MEQKKNLHKEFVKVRADFIVGGKIVPLLIKTENDMIFKIDKILDERDATSLKAGGQGRRYTCRIGDKEIYLFHDREDELEFFLFDCPGSSKSIREVICATLKSLNIEPCKWE